MQGCNVNHIPRLLVQSCEVKCFSGGHITIASVPAETRVGFIYEQAWDHKEEGETKASNAFIKPSSFLLCKVMCVCVCLQSLEAHFMCMGENMSDLACVFIAPYPLEH